MANPTKITVTINQPVEKAWETFMNPDNLKYWLTGFISAEHVSGEAGKKGAVSKLTFRERGKKMEVTETVTAIEPHQQYSFTMVSAAFNAETDIRFISFGSRTELIQVTRYFPKQFIMKLMMPLIKGAMKKRMEDELVRFKKFTETKS